MQVDTKDLVDLDSEVGRFSHRISRQSLVEHTGVEFIDDRAVLAGLTTQEEPVIDIILPPSRAHVVYVDRVIQLTPRLSIVKQVRMITSGRPAPRTTGAQS